MFSSYNNRLRTEIDTVKLVLDAHDGLRALVYPAEDAVQQVGPNDAHLEQIRASGLIKPAWQTYDHCAAFTRLYAVYEQFVDDLTTDYLRILPGIYKQFADLPQNVRTQLRLGIGQILGKLGKDGPYKNLSEVEVIEGWAHGLLAIKSYSLLADAFLIDPQNYRAATLTNLFRYLGFDDCWPWVEKHPAMLDYLKDQRDANETARTLLHDFVEYRNKASHTGVAEIVATDEIKSIADYVTVLCETLSQLLMKRVVQRKQELGEAVRVGSVIHKFSNLIVGARMAGGTIAVGEELVVLHKHSCQSANVVSLRIGDVSHNQLALVDNQEIGIELSAKANVGAELVRVSGLQPPLIMENLPEIISPDDPVEMTDPHAQAAESIDGSQ